MEFSDRVLLRLGFSKNPGKVIIIITVNYIQPNSLDFHISPRNQSPLKASRYSQNIILFTYYLSHILLFFLKRAIVIYLTLHLIIILILRKDYSFSLSEYLLVLTDLSKIYPMWFYIFIMEYILIMQRVSKSNWRAQQKLY